MNSQPTPSEDQDLDGDSVWSLVDRATTPALSPAFMQDTLRRCRLEEGSTSWWKNLFTNKSFIGASAAVACVTCVAITIMINHDGTPDTSVAITPPLANFPAEMVQLEDAIGDELIAAAAEDPNLLSENELMTLLF